MKKIIIFIILFLLIYISSMSKLKQRIVKVELIGKKGIKTYYIKFSNSGDLNSFKLFDSLD